MEITLLGTGCPVAVPERRGAATLVRGASGSMLIDCGSGVAQRLVEAGVSGAEVDALAVTHLHSDHLIDFYQLVLSSWHQGRDRPWTVFCAANVRAFLQGVMDVWAEERAARIAFEKRPSTAGLEIAFVEIADGSEHLVGDLALRFVAVDHGPVEPAFGLIAEAGGTRAVISGDTRYCPALIEAGRGADLLVHEVFLHGEIKPIPGVRSAETVAAVASYHTLSAEVGRVAAEMQARALALTHFVPPRFDRAALLAEVAESYSGPVFVGEDLMRFDLAAGDVVWGDFRARLL